MCTVRTERHIYIKRLDAHSKLVLPNTDDTPARRDLLAAGWEQQPRHQEMLYDLYFDPARHIRTPINVIDQITDPTRVISLAVFC